MGGTVSGYNGVFQTRVPPLSAQCHRCCLEIFGRVALVNDFFLFLFFFRVELNAVQTRRDSVNNFPFVAEPYSKLV